MNDCVLRFPATLDGFAGASEALRLLLDERGLEGRSRYYVELVFEEIVANIVRHGEAEHLEPEVEVALAFEAAAVVLRFRDDGTPFDPREHVPDRSGQEDERLGGFGIKIVRHVSSTVDYERTADAQNCLTVTIATS